MAKLHRKQPKSTPLRNRNVNARNSKLKEVKEENKNVATRTKTRNLTIKNSLKQIAAEKEEILKEPNFGNPLKEKVAKVLNSQVLNKENLKILQESISEFEISADNCEHYICSLENMYTIDFSRLWFLFELEMTEDGNINLRNDCYHKKVYKILDPNWIQSNALEQKIANCEKDETNFNMKEIILPQPIAPTKKPVKRKRKLSDISISIESIIEDSKIIRRRPNTKDQNLANVTDTFSNSTSSNLNIPTSPTPQRFNKLMPRDPLTERYKMKIFDNFPINVRKLLREKDLSSKQSEETSSHKSLSSTANHKCKLSFFNNGH